MGRLTGYPHFVTSRTRSRRSSSARKAPVEVRCPAGSHWLVFSPDGKVLAVQGKKGIELISVETGKNLTTIGGQFPVHFTKDGKTLTGFVPQPKPGEGAAIKVWELIWKKEPGK